MSNKVAILVRGVKIAEVTPCKIPRIKNTMTYYHRKGTKYYFRTLTGRIMLNVINDEFKAMKYGDVLTYKIK